MLTQRCQKLSLQNNSMHRLSSFSRKLARSISRPDYKQKMPITPVFKIGNSSVMSEWKFWWYTNLQREESPEIVSTLGLIRIKSKIFLNRTGSKIIFTLKISRLCIRSMFPEFSRSCTVRGKITSKGKWNFWMLFIEQIKNFKKNLKSQKKFLIGIRKKLKHWL